MPDSPDKIERPGRKVAASATVEAQAAKSPVKAPAKPVRDEASGSKSAPSAPRPAARGKRGAGSAAARKPAEAKAARRAARVARAAQRPQPSEVIAPETTIKELKESIMATNNTDFTQPITEAIGDMQNRAKTAYEKGSEVATELTEFAKGNVEAVVESSKIFATGAQSLGKTYVEEAKSSYETMTADMKELAAVRSPAELFQLQGKIMRRNFDTIVATTSKNGEAVVKLANDAFAPFTGRVNVAAEKLSKVA